MFRHISEHEIRLLSELKDYGDQPALPSNQRVRLEMLGLVTDGPRGIRLTEKGERLALRTGLRSWITVSTVSIAKSDFSNWSDTNEESEIEEPSDTLQLVLSDTLDAAGDSPTP